jgi:ATP-dependent exoDNAse (exonuclease V) beta subunit
LSVLEPDGAIQLPSITVLKASAGSGKTRTLTERYVQFLLSPVVPKNALRNILAITFSNNASREMKDSILLWLKSLHFRDPGRLVEIASITGGGEAGIVRRAGEMLENVLSQYSDFQVRTIDSFLSTIFRASAIELGVPPDFRIELNSAPLMEYAFDLFLRDARQGSEAAAVLDRAVVAVVDQRGESDGFPWEPASTLRSRVMDIEKHVGMLEADPVIEDTAGAARGLAERILGCLEEVEQLVRASGLKENPRSAFRKSLGLARAGMFADIATRGMATGPVKKPAGKAHGLEPAAQDLRALAAWEKIAAIWEKTRALAGEYAALMARGFYAPYLRLHAELCATLERVKKTRGIVFISDVSRKLLSCMSEDMVPEVYFRIGEKIFHYLIDEFQDTSPLQWRNLHPLIENSLAQGGSLFVVGDTKQAIYGFRHADYTIMRSMESESPFPSTRQHTTLSMQTNFRSRPAVVRLSERVFRENAAVLPEYREAVHKSGLDDWRQSPHDTSTPGRVSVEILARNDEDPPERVKLHALIDELHERGYRWGDIAVLASRNDQIVKATSWLNEMGVPFLSYSSLDVRRRKTAGEMLALLTFLDSPKDDLSFVTFILGDVFKAALADAAGSPTPMHLHRFLLESKDRRPLYKAFQLKFPEAWERFFAGLFRSAGYLPLYDLVSEIYAAFDVFEKKPDEEATLAKLLETIKDFEGRGSNSLRDFLRFAESREGDSAWDIDVPEGADSVRAMTIHKAKGLGFPVVIALLYGERNRGFGHTVLQEEGQLRLVKLTRQLSRADAELSAVYDGELLRDKVSKLNGLYVAITRAKEEMYVIGVKGERDSFPFDVLPETGFAEGAAGRPPASGAPHATPALLSHAARPVPPSVGAKRLGHGERARGELVHAALSRITYASAPLEAQVLQALGRAARAMRADAETDYAELARATASLIGVAPLAELFSARPERTVFTEWEVCSAEGKLFRMDRVVVDKERITVIDWKTGAEEDQEDQHQEQLANYSRILQAIYPGRQVSAILAYLDRVETRSLS